MSYGSISKEAHENLAIAMKPHRRAVRTPVKAARDADRYVLEANGDSKAQRDQAGGVGTIRA